MANPLISLATRAAAGVASRQLAGRIAGAQLGPIGTLATVALPFLLRRISPLGVAAMAIGAWGVGKLAGSLAGGDNVAAGGANPAAGGANLVAAGDKPRAPLVTPPPIAWSMAPDVY
jgi:hypothetical protein